MMKILNRLKSTAVVRSVANELNARRLPGAHLHMTELPPPLQPLSSHDQFILWTLTERGKVPIDYRTGNVADAHDPAIWLKASTALSVAGDRGVGFVFTEADPFFFLDIDHCLEPSGKWSALALSLLTRLPGAAVEVSQSGQGLHVFGKSTPLQHSNKNIQHGIELYTSGRFVALTGTGALGDAGLDCTTSLSSIINEYFTPAAPAQALEWTSEPCADWCGLEDDTELITRALATQSAASVFGTGVSFSQLWFNDEDALSHAYPDPGGIRAYDSSSADAALAQHFAFWTGNNCERMNTLMLQSKLVRDKWNREDYLPRTILKATSLQTTFHSTTPRTDPIAEAWGAPKLKASSDAQRNYGNNIRAQKLAAANGNEDTIRVLSSKPTAKFWIDNQDKTPDQLVAMITPVSQASNPFQDTTRIVSGYQYLSADLQLEHFKGCCYIQEMHRAFTPNGSLLKSDQFNATYGGYVFQLDESGDATTKKAWEAFTESQVVRHAKAEAMCFRPELETGALVREEGRVMVNIYVPIDTPRASGDPAPFINQCIKMLPDENDRAIVLAYMAACIQHRGVKFQWAPLLQGTEGNGKTLLTECVAFAIGHRYTHMPRANEISEKFNEWLFYKLFIGIEDIKVFEHKQEVIEILKPMITRSRLAMRAMQQSEVMGDNRANFMLNSNHKDAIRKTRNDRRFAVFYTAQQSFEDIERDGMDGDYFPKLYEWLRTGGYAIVAQYLESYAIPDELNPATHCHRAPDTSSTFEAITASMGGVEQEIMEAVEEGRPGFAGGWISSMALERMLKDQHLSHAIPHNKRREMLKLLGYDWHPALHNGRVNNTIPMDNGKPRLFIRDRHVSRSLQTANEVAKAYQDAQGMTIAGGSTGVQTGGR